MTRADDAAVDDGRVGETVARMRADAEKANVIWFAGENIRPYGQYSPDDILAILDALVEARRQVDAVMTYVIEADCQAASSERRHVDREWDIYLMGREDTARTIMEMIRNDTPPQGEDATG